MYTQTKHILHTNSQQQKVLTGLHNSGPQRHVRRCANRSHILQVVKILRTSRSKRLPLVTEESPVDLTVQESTSGTSCYLLCTASSVHVRLPGVFCMRILGRYKSKYQSVFISRIYWDFILRAVLVLIYE